MSRRRSRALHLTPVLVVSLALVSACSSGTSSSGTSSSGTGTGSSSTSSAASGDPRAATVTVTADQGCTPDKVTFPAGGITFKVTNKDATAVSEVELLDGQRIIGEKENLPAGFSGNFAVNADAGTYTLYCPGAKTEKTEIKVTGTTKDVSDEGNAALLKKATDEYATYVNAQMVYLLSGSQALAKALHGTNLKAAQVAYAKARPYYEKIEPVAESFTLGKENLDAQIDARAGDVPEKQWTGFHRIEKGLFADQSLKGLAAYGDGLVTNVKKLQRLTIGLTYQPTELANGAQELLDEVASSKITGEEERYSHIDMLDFANNDEGAEQAFASLQPVLKRLDPALTKTISTRFDALDSLVGRYRSTSEPSGYVLYTKLTTADKRKLAAAVKAVQEPLSKIAGKVARA